MPQDRKYIIKDSQIIKKSNGETIPDDEPVFILRARDALAIPLLVIYEQLCLVTGCTPYQIGMVVENIGDFSKFMSNHSERMKQPGCTLGR